MGRGYSLLPYYERIVIMAEMKPNHICKNPNCRKHYYACDLCDRNHSYKAVACSIECFKIYTDLVLEARSKGTKIDKLPDRTDMTKSEVAKLMKKPVKEVAEKTKMDLKEYSDDTSSISLSEFISEVNKTIDNKKTQKNETKKK